VLNLALTHKKRITVLFSAASVLWYTASLLHLFSGTLLPCYICSMVHCFQ
jgi:hypothetical protein